MEECRASLVGMHQLGDLPEDRDITSIVLLWRQKQEDVAYDIATHPVKVDPFRTDAQGAYDTRQVG